MVRTMQRERNGQIGKGNENSTEKLVDRQTDRQVGRQAGRLAIDNAGNNKNTHSNVGYRMNTVPVRSCYWLPDDLIGAGVRQRGSMVGRHLVI